jgi:hypothetical protein
MSLTNSILFLWSFCTSSWAKCVYLVRLHATRRMAFVGAVMKEIPLTQGKVALVDDEDFEELNRFKWYARRDDRRGKYYAQRKVGPCSPIILMHRVIIKTLDGLITDHKDGNGLNNQKTNLRKCTEAENSFNKILMKNNTSGYKGVDFNKASNKFRARIAAFGRKICVGYFNNKTDAAIAYNQAAIKYHGEFARLNIIEQH